MRSLRARINGSISPQSEQAQKAGCICAGGPRVVTPQVGERRRQRWFWFDSECPVHGAALLDTFGKAESA